MGTHSNYLILFIMIMFVGACSSFTSQSSGTSSQITATSTPIKKVSPEELAAFSIVEQSDSLQQLILWTKDKESNPTTHWISGNRFGAKAAASHPGLILPQGENVWKLVHQHLSLPLCDCDEWKETDYSGPCPQSMETANGQWPALHNLMSDETISILPQPSTDDPEINRFKEIHFFAEIAASIGPYLFIRYGEKRTACQPQQNEQTSGFTLFDLRNQSEEDLFTDKERTFVLENEQTLAYEQLKSNPAAVVNSPEDITLTAVIPVYVNGAGMTLQYQFSVDVGTPDESDNWNTYTNSVIVPAQQIPSVILPFAVIQPAMQTLAFFGDSVHVGGWLPVVGDTNQLRTLVDAIFGIEVDN